METIHLLLLLGVGILAGFLNVNAGGGSSLTLPALLFLGLDAAAANGTNRVALLMQNIAAVRSFQRDRFHDFKTSLILALFTIPGAVIGSLAATRVDNWIFRRILGGVLVFVVFSMIFGRYRTRTAPRPRSFWLYPALFGIGFYGGFIQVGVGFLLMAALFHLLRVDLVRVNMHKVFIVLVYTLPALAVFLSTGNVVWGYGLALAAGNMLGGWLGARIAVRGGEKIIRLILAGAVLLMAAKLFNLF
jgi:uncharacterized membrane protein YfcA